MEIVETETSSETEPQVRDNAIEREYWKQRGCFLSKENPVPLPKLLYHQAPSDPTKIESIKNNGLAALRRLDVSPERWRWGREAVFLGDDSREDSQDPVVVVSPDPLDSNWITTQIHESDKESDAMYGNVWMHVGQIPKEQIVEIRPAKEV
jgi:hypothetical protein